MNDEKQINNAKNERRDNYCIRIQKALNYKGNCDHEDVWSILVAFEKEITNELVPENAAVLTNEEQYKIFHATEHRIDQLKTQIAVKENDIGKLESEIDDLKYELKQTRKQTACEILDKVGKVCGDYQWFKNLREEYEVEVQE